MEFNEIDNLCSKLRGFSMEQKTDNPENIFDQLASNLITTVIKESHLDIKRLGCECPNHLPSRKLVIAMAISCGLI
jgi:hypothetical protein